MFIAAGCMYIVGNEIQAKKMIKTTVIGYVIVQIAPALMLILHNATKNLGNMQ
jgi:hypothetical protein